MIASIILSIIKILPRVVQSLITQKYIRIVQLIHIKPSYPTSFLYLHLQNQVYTAAMVW